MKKYRTADTILHGTGIGILDAVIIIRDIINNKDKSLSLNNYSYCKKIIELGENHFTTAPQKTLFEVFLEYLEDKKHLKPDSLKDIKKLGNRIFRTNANLRNRLISTLKHSELESILERTFCTPSQFNKARMMLHGLFNFAIRKEFCDKNPISQIPKKRITEKEIVPLSLPKIHKLYKSAESNFSGECVVPFALMLWAGIRPREVRRLRWKDIDLTENIITITSQNSKTGGTRHITILPVLKKILLQHQKADEMPIIPPNWDNKWRYVRKHADLQAKWQQDVLRHTFASYHAKHFKNLPHLQLEMGHHNLSLLRSRYINMQGISKKSAKEFFRSKYMKSRNIIPIIHQKLKQI